MPERQPIHMRVREEIRLDITSGAYVGALPSMDKLAERHGVSRVTMRHALKFLEEEGLLRIRQGVGTFVNIPEKPQEGATRDFKSELPGTFNEAIGHYVQFLANSQIPREVRARMIQIIDAQIGLVQQLQQPTINPK